MPDWLAVIVLGVVEGITEFLPVSSTGHLLLAENMLGIQRSDTFIIAIQSGAALAVLPLFPERMGQLWRARSDRRGRDYLLKLCLAFGITALGGLLLERGGFSLPETIPPIAIALLAGGILFLAVESAVGNRPQSGEVTWSIALLVGLGQLVAAIFPGASRSGTTILVALLLGLRRTTATEFSFLVGVPTLLAAGGYKILETIGGGGALEEDWGELALGFLVSALVSFAAVKWLLGYVRTHTFHLFGWYRIGVGAALLGWWALAGPE